MTTLTNNNTYLELLDHCIDTLQWDERLDECICSILNKLDNHQDEEGLSFALRVAPYKYAFRYYLCRPPQQWYDHGYFWMKHVLNQEGLNEALNLVDKAFPSDDLSYQNEKRYLINNVAKEAAARCDIAMLDFCKASGVSFEDTFTLKVINQALEHCSSQTLEWAFEQSPSFQSMRMAARMVRCTNMGNEEGLRIACQFVKKHDPDFFKNLPISAKGDFFHSLLKNYHQKTWECLRDEGYLEHLPLDFEGIDVLGHGYKHIQTGSQHAGHVLMLQDMMVHWEGHGVDWITPFVGGMKEYPSTLNVFFQHFPDMALASLPVLGSYYVEKNKNELPSLYAISQKTALLDSICLEPSLQPFKKKM